MDIQTALRQAVAAIQPPRRSGPQGRIALGASGPDAALGGGFCRGALHEIIAAAQADAPAAAGFIAGLCARAVHDASASNLRAAERERRKVVWVRSSYGETEGGKLYPQGLVEMGIAPDTLIHVRLKDVKGVLRAGVEAVLCNALSAVVIEPPGDPRAVDLTATRRLALAAGKSGVPVFLLRVMEKAEASAAMTRWRVRSAASQTLEANAPGRPAFDLALLRHRGGPDGLRWQVEWNRDAQLFTEPALLRPMAALSSDRSAASPGTTPRRRAG